MAFAAETVRHGVKGLEASPGKPQQPACHTHDAQAVGTFTTHFRVGMTCGGCSGAVERILRKIDGVKDVRISLTEKRVEVDGTASPAVMLAALQKWGAAGDKEVALLDAAPAS
jgi:copper chaperone